MLRILSYIPFTNTKIVFATISLCHGRLTQETRIPDALLSAFNFLSPIYSIDQPTSSSVLVYLAIHSLIAVTARHPTIVGLGTPFACAFRQTITMKTLSSYYKILFWNSTGVLR
jgi:hypothetical protein